MKIKMHCFELKRSVFHECHDSAGKPLKEPTQMLVDYVELAAESSPLNKHCGVELTLTITNPEFIGTYKVGQCYEIDLGTTPLPK